MTKVDRIRVFADQYPEVLHNGYVVSITEDVNKLAVFNSFTKNVELYYWNNVEWYLKITLEYNAPSKELLYTGRLGINEIGTTVAAEHMLSPDNEGLVCVWYLSGSTWRYEGLCLPHNVKNVYDIDLKHDNLHTLNWRLECLNQHLK